MTTRHRATLGAGAATLLAFALAGCGTEDTAQSSEDSGASGAAPSPSAQSMPSRSGQASSGGVTTAGDVFGPGCSEVPSDPSDPGSVQGMVDDPVGTAASNNPLLTSLTAAVESAGLVDTLNDSAAGYTVFAPADPAFEALPADEVDALLNDPERKKDLTDILTYHVVPERMSADQLSGTDSVPTVQGADVAVEGSGEQLSIAGADVLCGNVPTANATVFVIDEVLMPPQ